LPDVQPRHWRGFAFLGLALSSCGESDHPTRNDHASGANRVTATKLSRADRGQLQTGYVVGLLPQAACVAPGQEKEPAAAGYVVLRPVEFLERRASSSAHAGTFFQAKYRLCNQPADVN
jgi:hypothetical protein